MAKRRANVAPAYIDLGPGLVRDGKGRPRSWGGAADVEVVERVDPDHPNRAAVKGAQRRDILATMVRGGSIAKPLGDAAARFLDDLSIATGSSYAGFVGMPGSGVKRDTLPDRQLRAIRRVYAIRNDLGLNDGTVFWWVVLDNQTVRAWEDRFRTRHGDGMTLLRAALEGLADWYDDHG